MHATIHHFRSPLGTHDLAEGALGAATLTQLGGQAGAVVTFWPNAAAADEAAARRPAGSTRLDTRVYRVVDGHSASEGAAHALITGLDCPPSARQLTAD